MKLLRKMLLVLLFLSLVLPASAAPETEKAKENALPSEMQCPECKKKINLEKELKKIKKNLKNKKKSKKKKKKDKKKNKDKDAEKNADTKAQEENKSALPKSIKCPKCKKAVKLPLPENEKKAETPAAEDAGNNGEE